MNTPMDLWNQTNGVLRAIVLALVIFVVFWVVSRLFYKKISPALLKRKTKKPHPIFEKLLIGFQRPITVYLQFSGVCFALLSLSAGLQSEDLHRTLHSFVNSLPVFLNTALRIGTVVAIAWGLVASSDITSLLLRNARNRLDLQMSRSVSHFLAAVFNVVVVAIACVIVLSELNYDINGLVAGLGLGGLTVALAAKDSAANFFGGLVLVVEKPFEIGDWISCNEVEGTVEDINLRSTKVRTSAGSLTTVPNAVLSGAPISNWSGAMEKRRADFTLNLIYGTNKATMQAFITEAEAAIQKDPDVLNDSIIVRFSDFSESSLAVRVVFYTALPGFSDHIAIRERVNYTLMELAQKHGIEFALPSRTIYLEPPDAHKDSL